MMVSRVLPPGFISSMLVLIFMIGVVSRAEAGKPPKYAPEKTYILMLGAPHPQFEESRFSNLEFYYLPELKLEIAEGDVVGGGGVGFNLKKGVEIKKNLIKTYKGDPDFLRRLGNVRDLVSVNNKMDWNMGMLLDKNGTVVIFKHFFPAEDEQYDLDEKRMFGRPGTDSKKNMPTYKMAPFTHDLEEYVRKVKSVKVDDKKTYTPGEEPVFKGWEPKTGLRARAGGQIEGMSLPDFEVVNRKGDRIKLGEIRKGKPMLILFCHIPADLNLEAATEAAERLKQKDAADMSGKEFIKTFWQAGGGSVIDNFLWNIERELYNNLPPRK